MKQGFAANLRRVMGYDRTVARLIAAWCSFAALTLMLGFGFDELEYAQDVGFGQLALGVALFFVAYTLIALPIPEQIGRAHV